MVDDKQKLSGSNTSGTQISRKYEYETSLEAFIRQNVFSVIALFGLAVGGFLGLSLKYSFTYSKEFWNGRALSYIALPSDLFYHALFYLKLPLTLSCIGAAIGSMDLATCKFAVWRVFAYILFSTFLASFTGGFVAIITHPGHKKDHPIHPVCYIPIVGPQISATATCTKDHHPCNPDNYSPHVWTWLHSKEAKLSKLKLNTEVCRDTYHKDSCEVSIDKVLDLVESFFPENIVTAFLSNTRRRPNFPLPDEANNKNAYSDCHSYLNAAHPKPPADEFDVTFDTFDGTNYKGVFAFIGFVAMVALSLEESGTGRPLLNVFTSLSHCTLTLGTWIIWFSFLGISSSITGNILRHDILELPRSVHNYIWTCVAASLFYTFCVLPLLYKVLTSKSPFRLYKRIMPAIGVSFGTASSAATIPVIINNLEEACHMDPRIVRFMVPISADFNLNGSALRAVVSIIYISQLHGVKIDMCTFFSIVFMTSLSLLRTFINRSAQDYLHLRLLRILQVIEMPGEFYVYVYGAEWFLDHFGTMTNVITNCVGTAIVDHYCIQQLEFLRLQEESKAAALKRFYSREMEPVKKENKINMASDDFSYFHSVLPSAPSPSAKAKTAQSKFSKVPNTNTQKKRNRSLSQQETKVVLETGTTPHISDSRRRSRSRSKKSLKNIPRSKSSVSSSKHSTHRKRTKSAQSGKEKEDRVDSITRVDKKSAAKRTDRSSSRISTSQPARKETVQRNVNEDQN